MPEAIELSVVMPCLNEEETIRACVEKIKDVLKEQGISGEIIVVDNGSSDRSVEFARNSGAKVFTEDRKGYGAAYLKGLQEAKGKYIIVADSDNTYDFLEIPLFLNKLREGFAFVMGTRLRGRINRGAMSWTHRYIGNPILSSMCRLFFSTKFSDIYCGMRAFTRESLNKMKLRCTGMEFAIEMVVSALQNNLQACEVPISYHPREGESKLKPLPDAWRSIRFMLLYCPAWLYFIPGTIGFIAGLFFLLLLLPGPFLFLGHHWDVHFAVFAGLICILSYQVLNLGIYAHTYAIREGFLKLDRLTGSIQKHFSLEKGIAIGSLVFLLGLVINIMIFIEWFSHSFGPLYRIRESILAMTLLVIGLQTIFSSFFISLLLIKDNK